MLMNFSMQGVILAAIYLTLGPSHPPSMIIWASIIAVAAVYPISYLIGRIFLNDIYETTL